MIARSIKGSLFAALLVMPTLAVAGDKEPGWTSYIDALGINGQIDQLATPRNYTVGQVSSYDTTGGAADDSGTYQRRDNEIILAVLDGPGCITRFWVKNPVGFLRIYIDDMETPVLMSQLGDFFNGDMHVQSRRGDIWVEPLLGASGGGYYCYVPMPYKERAAIVVESPDPSFTYQINYATFPADTELASFSLTNNRADYEYFKDWKKEWETANFQLTDKKTETYRHSRHHYYPGKNVLLYKNYGPGVVTELEFTAESVSEEILANAWLQVNVDGQENPSILCPLGALFGSPVVQGGNFTSLPVGRDGDRMWMRFPIPFHDNIEMRIINGGTQILDMEYYIVTREGDIGDQLYFIARQQRATTEAGQPYRAADIQGQGHFVGMTMGATGGQNLEFLTGDDIIVVDGKTMDAHYGTGTDDFFNGGWFFAENPYDGPMAGGGYKSAAAPTGFAAARGFVNDAVPFNQSLTIDLEHGEGNNAPGMDYNSVVYWYQTSPEAPLKPTRDFDLVRELYAKR